MELSYSALGAMLGLGLAGLGVTIGQGILAKKSVEILGKNPTMYMTMMIYTVLGLALVESAAIYSLVVALQLLSKESIDALSAVSAGLSIGITGFGVGLMEGIYVAHCLEAMNRNPEERKNVLQFMILFLALLESVAIYGLVISFTILGK